MELQPTDESETIGNPKSKTNAYQNSSIKWTQIEAKPCKIFKTRTLIWSIQNANLCSFFQLAFMKSFAVRDDIENYTDTIRLVVTSQLEQIEIENVHSRYDLFQSLCSVDKNTILRQQ